MENPLKTLVRLAQRKPQSGLISELHSRAIGRPLLAHASISANVIAGFLSNPALENSPGDAQYSSIVDGIGVLDISGALVSRPMGYCSPLSYVEIAQEFDALMESESVQQIVLRIDSPGGEASGCFDLSDHIYGMRGIKPIIAIVDDMAFSGGYAIASAADKIFVSRTGGVGSVGVVVCHVDRSEQNKKNGIKVEFVQAGDRKTDGHPHGPLSDPAREGIQSEVSRLNTLFLQTVSRNIGMPVETVKAFQAACVYGEDAVNAGLAHELGTFSGIVNNLLSQTNNAGSQALISSGVKIDADPVLVTESTEEPAEDAGENTPEPEVIGAGSSDAQVEQNTLPQVDADASADNTINAKSEAELSVPQSLTTAEQAEIKAMCAAAGMPDVAGDYITANISPAQVRADLFAAVTAGEQEINTAEPVLQAGSGNKQVTAAGVYARRNQRNKRGK